MIQQETLEKSQFSLIPESIDELRALVMSQQKRMESLEAEEENYRLENDILRERVKKLLQQLYGRKSEKNILDDDSEQMFLFGANIEDDAESALFAKLQAECAGDDSDDTITIPEHKRKKGRKPLPEHLPRVEVIHDLSEEAKKCQCGCEMSRIGEESSEKLEMLPPQFWVARHVRYKYACKHCEGLESTESPVKLAPPPVQILPKSIATPSLLAHLFVSKFADALPFYRQESQFMRYGIDLSRAVMCNWAFKIADKSEHLLELLRQELLSGPLISIDETTVQVLKEPGRSADSKSYMWVFRGGGGGGGPAPPDKKIVLFRYSPSRSGEVVRQFIGNYRGYVQTDGYAGYDYLDAIEDIIHMGCWAHARRKFVEVARQHNNTNKKHKKKGGIGIGKCGHAIQAIAKLYGIEKKARRDNLSIEDLYQLRQDEAKPILDEFGDWLQDNRLKIPPTSPLGEAFNYAINQWPRLINYLKSGIVPIDNNLTENAIRPFVVGRKNWLFSDQPRGAHASALFYSLIETAKANGLEPYSYLLYLFDRLPYAATEEDYKILLPLYVTAERLGEFRKEYWLKCDEEALKK